MLAKQFWRLHSFPNSLLARCLKAKYFPSSLIWDSKVGANSSFSWRSTRSSKEILVSGSRWCIGNGKYIIIWGDAWVAGAGSGKIISPRRGISVDMTVASLFDPVPRCWREYIIFEIMLPIDVSRILGTPIGASDRVDNLR